MSEKKKQLKKIGTAVILLALILFAVCNVRFRPAGGMRPEPPPTALSPESAAALPSASDPSSPPADPDGAAVSPPLPSDAGPNEAKNGLDGTEAAPRPDKGNADNSENGPSAEGDALQTPAAGAEEGALKEPAPQTYITCSIEIRCDSAAAQRPEIQNPGIRDSIPEDGTILAVTEYRVTLGTTVYEVLRMAASDYQIPVTANAKGSYISSINNLSEKMLGMGSGWTYRINGKMVMKPASGCIVAEGDQIRWIYVTG